MKTLAVVTMSFIFSLFATAQSETNVSTSDTLSITVKLENARNQKGNIVFGLYDKTTFLQAPLMGEIGEIQEDGSATVTFTDVDAGEYAIVCFHDMNKNSRMDFQPSGMPAEDYGMTGGPATMGPPQWSSAKFVLTESSEFSIRF